MIHPWLAEQIANRKQLIQDGLADGEQINLQFHRDLFVTEIGLNEKKTHYKAKLDSGQELTLDRVTTLADKWDKDLLHWGLHLAKEHGERAMAECYRQRQLACEIGNDLHAYAARRMDGLRGPGENGGEMQHRESEHCGRIFDSWWESVKNEYALMASEFQVWNTWNSCAGTIDALLWHKPTKCTHLIDLKSTDKCGHGYLLQQGAYQGCLMNLLPPDMVPRRGILLMCPKPEQCDKLSVRWIRYELWRDAKQGEDYAKAFGALCLMRTYLEGARVHKKISRGPVLGAGRKSMTAATLEMLGPLDHWGNRTIPDKEVEEMFEAFK